MVPAGSVLDFTARGTTEWSQFQIFFTPTMLEGDVRNKLSARFSQPVDVQVVAEGVITGTMPYKYTATVRVKTTSAHAATQDVGSIVANVFYQSSGSVPVVSLLANHGTNPQGQAELPPPPEGFKFPNFADLFDFSWSTALVVVGVAVMVIAWKR